MAAPRRLDQIQRSLASQASTTSLGRLSIGELELDVEPCEDESRLPRSHLLDPNDPYTTAQLRWLLQTYLLKRDAFLLSAPGPYARRLVNTFASLANVAVEHIAIHRDTSEAELKQSREIRPGGSLEHVDSPVVRAAKHGRWLILEGIERAERGVLPTLNALIEAREINLEDGTHIISPNWYETLRRDGSADLSKLIAAHPRFRVFAIGAPVPPYTGTRLDPPFRSRFAARYLDISSTSQALARPTREALNSSPNARWLSEAIATIILATQHATELSASFSAVATTSLKPFPQTALTRLNLVLAAFPPDSPSPDQLARLLLTLNPALQLADKSAWTTLSEQAQEANVGELGDPHIVLDGAGLLGYRVQSIERADDRSAKVTFVSQSGANVVHTVAAGPRQLATWPLQSTPDQLVSPRFSALLTTLIQLHALGLDVLIVPSAARATASSSTNLLIDSFARLFGYERESVHLYKELGGRELVMRRELGAAGVTSWAPSPLLQSATAASAQIVTLSGIDTIGPTAGSLARLFQDREFSLWEGRRLEPSQAATETDVDLANEGFRIIGTASKSMLLRDWLTEELVNMAMPLVVEPMDVLEELDVLARTGCAKETLELLVDFAAKYRLAISSSDSSTKHQGLGTRALIRVAQRLALTPWADMRVLLERATLFEFWPASERQMLISVFEDCGIMTRTPPYNPPAEVKASALVFPAADDPQFRSGEVSMPRYDLSKDPEGVKLIPQGDDFYDNSLQTALMRDIATDLVLQNEHIVLLGNQGTGKNRICDRLLQLLGRPREFIQLHRDSTVGQLLFHTSLIEGSLSYVDSPLLRAVALGRVIIIDEADKASSEVVAVLRSLAERGEMTLPDGRRIRPQAERDTDIAVHPDFRLILLANRPGWPFLGNSFVQVLGDSFSTHSASNPDRDSELRLLAQLAPELDELVIGKLVNVFQDLRMSHQEGRITYPFSLRELLNLIKHLKMFPKDQLSSALRSITDFDVHDQTTLDELAVILGRHRLGITQVGLAAIQDEDKKPKDVINFKPRDTSLSEPKHGKFDGKEHHGGNTWAGGTGGRDTAGMGGKGGPYRMISKPGQQIYQISDEEKESVPEHIKAKAREMAKAELARKLKEIEMSSGEAGAYIAYHRKVSTHINTLRALLDGLEAQEEERSWLKRKTDGELDENRLAEGLSGDAAIYRRRGYEKPEAGRPQLKPKRIVFLFDVSASMYRFQYDGRLDRSLETAILVMEAFTRLNRPDKYSWSIVGHSGDGPSIPFTSSEKPPIDASDRYKVIARMALFSQMAFSGDYTIEAIEKAADTVAEGESDDRFVIALTDAPFARYSISKHRIKAALNRQPSVKTAMIVIGEAAEDVSVQRAFPGKVFAAKDTAAIPLVLRSILQSMLK